MIDTYRGVVWDIFYQCQRCSQPRLAQAWPLLPVLVSQSLLRCLQGKSIRIVLASRPSGRSSTFSEIHFPPALPVTSVIVIHPGKNVTRLSLPTNKWGFPES